MGIKVADQVISIMSGIFKIKGKDTVHKLCKVYKVYFFSYGGMSLTIRIPLYMYTGIIQLSK